MSWTQDLKYSTRMLLRSPGFTAIAVLSLALGIGANTAIFSIVKGVLIQPLPYDQPHQLVTVSERLMEEGNLVIAGRDAPGLLPVSAPNFYDWRDENKVFSGMSYYFPFQSTTTGVAEPERLVATSVSGEFFDVMGVQPLYGRGFTMEEDQPGRNGVAVISYGLWQRWFGGSHDAIGKTFKVDGNQAEIIGIAPPGFDFPDGTEVWNPGAIPATVAPRNFNFLSVVARIKADTSLQGAQDGMDSLARAFEGRYPATSEGRGVWLTPLENKIVGDVRPALLVLWGAVGLVLLIACSNVANLMLAKSSTRRAETAIRMAVGAGPIRLLRQFLTESMLLGLVGGTFGLILAWFALESLLPMVQSQLPRVNEIRLDSFVLFFAAGVSLVSGILFGLAPAYQFTQQNLNEALKDGA
ncbi:MAG: ABC transporter permease [Acidobacteriota bacterium]